MDFKYKIVYLGKYPKLQVEPNEKITGYIHNIAGWLDSDVQSFGESFYLPRIKEILYGDNPDDEEFWWGNAYKATIRRDYSTIVDCFEEVRPDFVPCTLPTEMLLEILKIWIDVKKEFDEKRKKERETK